MIVLFLVVCLVVAFLIFVMFLILKKTVRIVNDQTKSYFVNKLQGYDDLITERENKLNEIDELIKSREIGKENNKKENNGGYAFDTSVIDLFNSTQYQDKNIFELNRKIDENFVVNYEELVRDFLTFCDDSKDYDFCLNLRNKFDSEQIYKFKSFLPGAVLCTASWYVLSFAISVYVSDFNGFSVYGGLTRLAVIMIWLYFCMICFMVCAEINFVYHSAIRKFGIKTIFRFFKK